MLSSVALETKDWCKAQSLNWEVPLATPPSSSEPDATDTGWQTEQNPILAPSDVQQVCFWVEQIGDMDIEVDTTGRIVMGMLNIVWRGPMGNWGSLNTGWLGVKR